MSLRLSPFPWASLPAVSRAEAEAGGRLARAAATLELGALAPALSALLRDEVQVSVTRTTRAEPPRGADDFAGFTLGLAGERSVMARVLVEVEAPLATVLVAKALERSAPPVTDGSRPLGPAAFGAVAAVVVAALRRALAGQALRVLAAGPGHALTRDLLASAPEASTAWLSVRIGGETFSAKVTVPDALAMSMPPRAFDDTALASMGSLRLGLPLVLARTSMDRAAIAGLAAGDVVLLEGTRVTTVADGTIAGPVTLVAPRAERGVGCDLAGGDRLVVRGDLEAFGWVAAEDTTMSETTNPTVTSAALEDAPVVVRVEVGTVEMTAGAWSELRPGDVVSLGRRLGDPAVLRVAGVEVARGELVQIDGEIGVRILGRTGA